MGHCRYRQGDLGRAALWYERARLFPPPSLEVRQNIAYIGERTGNITFFKNGLNDQYSDLLSRSHWLIIVTVCAWVGVFALVFRSLFFRRFKSLRSFSLITFGAALLFGTLAALGWYWHPSYEKLRDHSIVTATRAPAYTAATVTGGTVINLPAGSSVRTLEERGDWLYVQTPPTDAHPDGLLGWMQKETLSPFWPFDPGYLE